MSVYTVRCLHYYNVLYVIYSQGRNYLKERKNDETFGTSKTY